MRELAIVQGPWIAAALLSVTALAGALVQGAWRWHAATRIWRARVVVRGLSRLTELTDGAKGWLEGVIQVEGDACPAFDGTPCAAATIATMPRPAGDFHASSTRAPRLVLDVGDQRLLVRGPVEVIGPGQTVRDASAERAHLEYEERFSDLTSEHRKVSDGERVRVAGTVRRRADDTAGYRETAATLALEGADGPVRIECRRPSGLARGAGFGLLVGFGALAVTGHAHLASMELVSPLARHDALQSLSARERLLLLDEDDHGGRAALLRETGDLTAALEETRHGSDIASLRERLALEHRPGRHYEFALTWLRLVRAIDARCRDEGRCLDRARLLAQTRTPDRWGSPEPNRAPMDVFFSARRIWEDAETTLSMGQVLWRLRLERPLVAELRVTWLLELAALLIVTDSLDGATRAIDRADDALDDPRFSPPAGERFARDIEHLRAVLNLRGGAEWHGRWIHGSGWCPVRELVELTNEERGRWQHDDEAPTSWHSLPSELALRLDSVRASGVLTESMLESRDGTATGLEYASHLAWRAGRQSLGNLMRWLERPACPDASTIEALVEETSESGPSAPSSGASCNGPWCRRC